jgi:hypothetical protein
MVGTVWRVCASSKLPHLGGAIHARISPWSAPLGPSRGTTTTTTLHHISSASRRRFGVDEERKSQPYVCIVAPLRDPRTAGGPAQKSAGQMPHWRTARPAETSRTCSPGTVISIPTILMNPSPWRRLHHFLTDLGLVLDVLHGSDCRRRRAASHVSTAWEESCSDGVCGEVLGHAATGDGTVDAAACAQAGDAAAPAYEPPCWARAMEHLPPPLRLLPQQQPWPCGPVGAASGSEILSPKAAFRDLEPRCGIGRYDAAVATASGDKALETPSPTGSPDCCGSSWSDISMSALSSPASSWAASVPPSPWAASSAPDADLTTAEEEEEEKKEKEEEKEEEEEEEKPASTPAAPGGLGPGALGCYVRRARRLLPFCLAWWVATARLLPPI